MSGAALVEPAPQAGHYKQHRQHAAQTDEQAADRAESLAAVQRMHPLPDGVASAEMARIAARDDLAAGRIDPDQGVGEAVAGMIAFRSISAHSNGSVFFGNGTGEGGM